MVRDASMGSRWIGLVVAWAAFVACSSAEDAAPRNNGVDDVRRACELRLAWQSPKPIACTDCLAVSAAPRCECSDNDYAGACRPQQEEELAEPTCDGVRACVNACPTTDCSCVDGCFAGKDACRARASALDGCLTETCAKYCR